MATLKQRLHRKNADGGYDVVHLETSASVVMRADGSTSVEQSLTEIESWDLLKYEEAGDYAGMPYMEDDASTLEGHPASDFVLAANANFAPSTHSHTKSQITDFPTSLPASDVYAWAKAASKPTYTYSEVGAAAANHEHANYATAAYVDAKFSATVGVSMTYAAINIATTATMSPTNWSNSVTYDLSSLGFNVHKALITLNASDNVTFNAATTATGSGANMNFVLNPFGTEIVLVTNNTITSAYSTNSGSTHLYNVWRSITLANNKITFTSHSSAIRSSGDLTYYTKLLAHTWSTVTVKFFP